MRFLFPPIGVEVLVSGSVALAKSQIIVIEKERERAFLFRQFTRCSLFS